MRAYDNAASPDFSLEQFDTLRVSCAAWALKEEAMSRCEDELVVDNACFPDLMVMDTADAVFRASSNVPQSRGWESVLLTMPMLVHDQLDISEADLSLSVGPFVDVVCGLEFPRALLCAVPSCRELAADISEKVEFGAYLAEVVAWHTPLVVSKELYL